MFLYFSMNLLWISLASVLVEVTISKEVTLEKTSDKMPLAVIQKRDSKKLQLAIPHEYTKDSPYDCVGYNYDDSEEEFMTACPPPPPFTFYRGNQYGIQEKWRETITTFSSSKLFFLSDYEGPDAECSMEIVPTVKKAEGQESESDVKFCSRSQAEMYEVGYPKFDFLPIYKICHSMAEGKGATLYSVHRIEAPSLLFQHRIDELPELNPLNSYRKSVFDKNLSTIKAFEEKRHYAYQFVGVDDMPTNSWKPTTEYLFNYTPITRNEDLFKGMIRAEFYTKLYSKENFKPLTLYSGTFQKEIPNAIPCTSIPCKSSIFDSFWRIIVDDDGHAIILVTQHTLKRCGNAFLCEKNRQVKLYKKGGCIYTCFLDKNDSLLELLDLPPLNLTGDLDFTFEVDGSKKSFPAGGQEPSDSKSTKTINLIDFLSAASFEEAIKNIDDYFTWYVNFQTDNTEKWSVGGRGNGRSGRSGGYGDTGHTGGISFMPSTSTTIAAAAASASIGGELS